MEGNHFVYFQMESRKKKKSNLYWETRRDSLKAVERMDVSKVLELNKLHGDVLLTCSVSDPSRGYLHTHLGMLLKSSLLLPLQKGHSQLMSWRWSLKLYFWRSIIFLALSFLYGDWTAVHWFRMCFDNHGSWLKVCIEWGDYQNRSQEWSSQE